MVPGWPLSPVAWLLLVASAVLAAPPDAVHVVEVGDGWHYAPAPDPNDLARRPAQWAPATLPHRIGTEPAGFYQGRFAVPAVWAGFRTSLIVRTSGGTVHAWLNGETLGARAPSALNARFDLTPLVRAGARNTLTVAVAAPGEMERPGLMAAWVEATGGLGVHNIDVTTWCLAQCDLVDVRATVTNPGAERFDGKLELALQPTTWPTDKPPVWRRGSDVRPDPGRSVAVTHTFEIRPPRAWRFNDPCLYRLSAVLRTRDGRDVHAASRHAGVRAVRVDRGRWQTAGEWMRLAGTALRARGATLVCTQPGQAVTASACLNGQEPIALGKLLDLCDTAGIVALLDVPVQPPGTAGWNETFAALCAEAKRHPCVWGCVLRGEAELFTPVADRLRQSLPALPLGRPIPDLDADASGFDFLVCEFDTQALRPDNDGYGRRLDDLVRRAAGAALVVVDRLEPADPGDAESIAQAVNRRRREAERRWPVAMLTFQLDPDPKLIAAAEGKLPSVWLKPPRHEARRDKDKFVVKSRFEATIASPVAQRIPCHSLAGYRLAWRAGPREQPVASGTVALGTVLPRGADGGSPGSGRGEVQWRVPAEAKTFTFAAELLTAGGHVVATHRASVAVAPNAKDKNKVDVRLGPPPKEEPAPPKPPVEPPPAPAPDAAQAACVHLAGLPFNNDGISWRKNPQDGDFDLLGRRTGDSFIADLLPKGGALVALPDKPAVTFRFPSKDDRHRNNVVCDGQRILLPAGVGGRAYTAAWFLGACHDGSKKGAVTLEYGKGQGRGELSLADWCSKPDQGQIDVLRTAARHLADGSEETIDCGLVAWRIPLDPARKLTAITLPRERQMHVFAISLIPPAAKAKEK